MPKTTLMPLPKQQFFTAVGTPLLGGKVYTYAAGTTSPKATFTDAAGTIPHKNPIVLNVRGEPPTAIFWSGNYRVEVRDALGGLIYTVDNYNTDPAGLWDLVQNLASGTASSMLGFIRTTAGAVKSTVQAKLSEFPSFADFGAAGAVDSPDATAAIQNMLKLGYGEAGTGVYKITAPLKISSLSSFAGKRPGMAFIGNTANVKSAIQKTNNATVAVKNFQSGVTTNIDCLVYTDPDWIDNGVSYPQKATLECMAFQGNPAQANGMGIYIEQGGGFVFRDLDICNVLNAIYAKEAWLTVVERVHALAKFVWLGGTSVTFTDCWTGAGPGSSGGYSFSSLLYSTMNSCGSDGATDTAYRFVNSKMTLNSCGCEGAEAATANSGTAIALDGGNEILLNNFNAIPKANQVVALFSCGSDNTATFNQGSSYFGVSGVNCPDLYVWGNNSVIVFNNYTFLNGSKNNPLIQFAPGVSTSVIIVNYGSNTKIFTSTGDGVTRVESLYDGGNFDPVLSFANGGSSATYVSRSGNWRKSGKVITVSGRIALSSKGNGTGQALITGWPTFAQSQDTPLNIVLQTGILNGPLAGVVDKNGAAQAVFNVRGATGDGAATEANFSNTTVIWFEFDYITD